MTLTPEDKVRILRELTRGAPDVFAARSDTTWRPVYTTLLNKHVLMHLGGQLEIGSYPLLPNGNRLPLTWWVAADFDGKKPKPNGRLPSDWKADVSKAAGWLIDAGANLFVNLSRSTKGAHLRVLFKEPVPGWMARRWMLAWLDDAQVTTDEDDGAGVYVSSFDRLFPAQDALSGRLNDMGNRMPGNLIGSPLFGRFAAKNGGTLPLDPKRVVDGNFEPDGKHWEHAQRALAERAWSEHELLAALAQAPGDQLLKPPEPRIYTNFKLPVINGTVPELDYTLKFCEFMRHVADPRNQTYQLWVALATQLHRFNHAGLKAFHELSAAHHGHTAEGTDRKWYETAGLSPVRCDTLVTWGYRCPHLGTPRCMRGSSPSHFVDYTGAEIL